MVRKDEPMKVTDLEAGEEAKSNQTAKPKSVFDRLAYGGTSRSSSKRTANNVDDDISKTEINKPGAGRTVAAKKGGNTSLQKSKSTSGNAAEPSSSSGGGGGSGTSVFDRLTSGEKIYRTTTQTGRKAVGRRAEQVPADKTTSKTANNKRSVNQSNDTTMIIPETMDETDNPSAERDETDALDQEEDPVIHISLIQPPIKVRSARPVVKKSARLPTQREQTRRRKSWRLQRIPLALVERTSLARGALPILPQTLAWICLIFNGFLPGTGTVLSGLLGICFGAPRFSAHVTVEHRFLGFIINLTVGIFQAVTVLFCLVGWCWSLGWGIILVKTAGYYKSWKKNNLENGQEDLPHVINSTGFNIKEEPRY